MFKNILVPTDGSELSEKAFASAIEFARLNGAKLVALSVAEPYPFSAYSEGAAVAFDPNIYEDRMNELARMHVQKLAERAKDAKLECETVVAQSFSPYEEIINTAKKRGCDVIFMGSHGRRGLNRLLIGSETNKVLTHTSLPVLVIR